MADDDAPDSAGASEARPAARSRLRKLLGPVLRWGLLVLALGLAAHLLADLEWRRLGDRLADADRGWIAVAVVLLLGRFAVWAGRWRLAIVRLESGPAPGLPPLFTMIMASAMVNHVTPAARVVGGLLRGRYLAGRTGWPLGRTYGAVLYDQLLHQVSMAVVTALGVIGAALANGRPRFAAAVAGGLVVAGVGGGAAWVRWRERGGLTWLAGRLAARADGPGRARRALAHGREAVDALETLLGDPLLAAAVAALGALYAVVNAGAQWAVFRSLGYEPGFLIVLAAVAVGMAAGAVVGTPGGLGAAEAALIAFFVSFGVGEVEATAATLLYRGLHYAVVFAVGIPSLIGLEARERRREEQEPGRP